MLAHAEEKWAGVAGALMALAQAAAGQVYETNLALHT